MVTVPARHRTQLIHDQTLPGLADALVRVAFVFVTTRRPAIVSPTIQAQRPARSRPRRRATRIPDESTRTIASIASGEESNDFHCLILAVRFPLAESFCPIPS